MSQIVEIPGDRSVEFPDEFTPEQMHSEILKAFPDLRPPKQASIESPNPYAAWGNWPKVEQGEFLPAFEAPQAVAKAVDAVIPDFKPDTPQVAQLIQMAGLEPARQAAETVSEKLRGAVKTVLSPGGAGLAVAAPMAPGLVGSVIATTALPGLVEGAKETVEGVKKGSLPQVAGGLTDVGLSGTAVLGGALGMVKAGMVKSKAPATAAALERTVTDNVAKTEEGLPKVENKPAPLQPQEPITATPVASVEDLRATENGGRIAIILPDGKAVVGGRIHADTWNKAIEAGVTTDAELADSFAGFVKPDGAAWGVNGKPLPNVSEVFIVGREAPKPPALARQRPPEPNKPVPPATEQAPQSAAPTAAAVSEPKTSGAATPEVPQAISKATTPVEETQHGRVGGMLTSGEVVLTLSGRQTTPFPDIRTDTGRKMTATVKRIDKWLTENALAEAESRGDEFNALQFRNENPKNLPQASKDSMELYLFGEQPKVLKKIIGMGGATPTEFAGKSQLKQLEAAIKSTPSEPLTAGIETAYEFGKTVSAIKDSAANAVNRLKAAGAYMKERLVGLPNVTDWDKDLGELLYAKQKSHAIAKQFGKASVKQIPKPERRSAIGVYVDAGGDAAILAEGAARTKGDAQRAYETAQSLTPEEKVLADNIRNYFDARFQDAQDAGILDSAIENYIHRLYPKESKWKEGVVSEIRTGFLSTAKPGFAKKRVFQYDYEAAEAGYKPVLDFVSRITAYDQALNEAIAARAFVKQQLAAKMPDGRPRFDVGGRGIPVPAGEPPREATLIKPQFKWRDAENPKNNRADYLPYNHPAFRKWKWVSQDEAGSPIMVQGDVLVHPDAIQQVKNLFNKSAIRAHPVGRALLSGSSTVKQTMLDLSGFHLVQVTVHGWEHRVFKVIKEINFDDPTQARLIKSGVVAAPLDEYHMFSEGLAGSSLTKHIPWLGPKLHAWNELLFEDYIPRLKMSMALHALDRNMTRFSEKLKTGKVTEDQIYRLTADQANAAFGELNYELMGRNKTTQDVLRLVALAPDFFEARAKFVGQAATQFGREQQVALGLGALTLYMTARIANKLLDDQYHFEAENAFSIVYKGRAYSLRTIQGDLLHLYKRPGQFFFSRVNPTTIRPLIEAGTGRDFFGRKRDTWEQFKDFASTIVPISTRGLFAGQEQKLWESFMNAMGITGRRWSAVTAIYEDARKFREKAGKAEPGEFIYDPSLDVYRNLKLALHYGNDGDAVEELKALLATGKKYAEVSQHMRNWANKPFTGSQKLEREFRKTLSKDDLAKYEEAQQERKELFRRFRRVAASR